MRALAYSLKGSYDRAVPDYDEAIRMKPDFAVALNNRAWAYFRWGKPAQGLPDVEKSLELQPDQRPLARHARPHPPGARRPARRRCATTTAPCGTAAGRMIKLYQCGLTEQRLYTGEIDGIWRPGAGRCLQEVRARRDLRSAARRRALPRRDVLDRKSAELESADSLTRAP